MTVNVENVRAFVADLRSGEFDQGRGYLAINRDDKTSYCCEGVGSIRACKALGLDMVPPVGSYGAWVLDGVDDLASVAVSEFYGFEMLDKGGWFVWFPGTNYNEEKNWQRQQLATLNDGGWTFNQIADLIEWYYLNGGKEDHDAWWSARMAVFEKQNENALSE